MINADKIKSKYWNLLPVSVEAEVDMDLLNQVISARLKGLPVDIRTLQVAAILREYPHLSSSLARWVNI
jgi:hypothetical protein